jgi:hypothetical protein
MDNQYYVPQRVTLLLWERCNILLNICSQMLTTSRSCLKDWKKKDSFVFLDIKQELLVSAVFILQVSDMFPAVQQISGVLSILLTW